MNDLDRLRRLLLGNEKEALDALSERIEVPENRATDVADILPEAIARSHLDSPRLADSLRAPVQRCLSQSIRERPEELAEALYPVMGPAIRRSIGEALKAFAQSLTQAIENSRLSPQGLRWRFEAWRAGIPFAELVLRRTLLYRVEQAFLVQRDSGLLISHVDREATVLKDSDAVSAMFTAIQEFVRESFSTDHSGSLQSADLGDFTLWAVHGPYASLVCVIRGMPPAGLRAELNAILERVHLQFGASLREFSGGADSIAGLREELEPCLQFELKRRESKSRPYWPIWLVLGGILLVAGYFTVRSWLDSRDMSKLRVALEATPGIVVTGMEKRGGRFLAKGLRDPLAPSATEVAMAVGLMPDRVTEEFTGYQSLEPDIVLRRVRDALRPSEDVTLTLDGDVLRLRGSSTAEWKIRAELIGGALPGISAVDSSALDTPVDQSALLEQLQGLADLIDGQMVLYEAESVTLRAGEEEKLVRLARLMADYSNLARELDLTPKLVLVGDADASGTLEINRSLSAQRAEHAKSRLDALGVDSELLRIEITSDLGSSGIPNPSRRRVIVRVEAPLQAGSER